MQPEETSSDTESDLVRRKIVHARARLGTSLADIPTGREYDSPPDKSDDFVHQTLKTTDSATLVGPLTEKTEAVENENLVARHEDKLGYMYILIDSVLQL